MPIIYKFTHIPTGKIYIGAKKHEQNFSQYLSSSTTVRRMMRESSIDWSREILMRFADDVSFSEVVQIEQALIKKAVLESGWDAVWNGHYSWGLGLAFSVAATTKRLAALRSDEVRVRNSQTMTEYWAKPVNRQAQSARRTHFIAANPTAKIGDGAKGGAATIASGKGAFGDPMQRLESARKGGRAQGLMNGTSGHNKQISQEYWEKVKTGELSHPKLMWITNGNITKQIFATEQIPEGFRRGRSSGMPHQKIGVVVTHLQPTSGDK